MQGDSLIFFAKYSPKCFKSGDSVALNKGVSNVYNCCTKGPWFSGRTVLSHGTSGGPIPLGSKKRGGLHGHLFLCPIVIESLQTLKAMYTKNWFSSRY